MIGVINLSIQSFVTETFGLETWKQIVEKGQIDTHWISNCPYSDKSTFK